MNERLGVGIALLGALVGGSAIAATRFAVRDVDPLGLTTLRYSIGALLLLPLAVPAVHKLGTVRQGFAAGGLGLLFCGLYPFMFTLALLYTTAARGALALSASPLLTLAFAIALGREKFSRNRLAGILIAVGGLAYALSPKLDGAAPKAWQGDLIMITAAAMLAVFNVLSRSTIQRMGALPFTAFGICVGALALAASSVALGSLHALPTFDATTWAVIVYLGVVGCALLSTLWSLGLRFASPSLVGVTITANPIVASLLGALFLSESVGHELVVGLAAVLLGIAVALNLVPQPSARAQ